MAFPSKPKFRRWTIEEIDRIARSLAKLSANEFSVLTLSLLPEGGEIKTSTAPNTIERRGIIALLYSIISQTYSPYEVAIAIEDLVRSAEETHP